MGRDLPGAREWVDLTQGCEGAETRKKPGGQVLKRKRLRRTSDENELRMKSLKGATNREGKSRLLKGDGISRKMIFLGIIEINHTK